MLSVIPAFLTPGSVMIAIFVEPRRLASSEMRVIAPGLNRMVFAVLKECILTGYSSMFAFLTQSPSVRSEVTITPSLAGRRTVFTAVIKIGVIGGNDIHLP